MVGGISQDRESCQFPFVFEENPLSYRSARPESGREVREGSSMELLARRSCLLEVRASDSVGLRWQAVFGCQVTTTSPRRVRRRCSCQPF